MKLKAYRSQTIYPTARVQKGSEVMRLVWGFTKGHALRRAERWIARRAR